MCDNFDVFTLGKICTLIYARHLATWNMCCGASKSKSRTRVCVLQASATQALPAVPEQMNRSGETVAQVLAKKEAAFRAAHPEAPQLRD